MNTSGRILLLALVCTASVVAQTPPPAAAPKPKLGSKIFKWEEMPLRQTAIGERRDVSDNPTSTLQVFECHITTLNPGQASHPPHRHATEELIIMKEGTVEVHINGNLSPAGPGSTLFYSSMDTHRVRNIGQGRATYFVVNLATAATYGTSIATEPVLPSRVYHHELLNVVPTAVGERRDIMNGRTKTLVNLETHITTLKPGATNHEPHRHPDDEVVLVREGTLEVMINGKTDRAGPGSVLFFSSNDLHNMKNVGPTPVVMHIIRMVTAATPGAETAGKATTK
jgi:quercetin dioxygenase-like cupin family protein